MRVTGLILALVGLLGVGISVFQLVQSPAPGRDVPVVRDGPHRPNMVIPLVVSGAAVVIGGLMFMFGGRGYVVTRDPSVRN